MSVSVISISLVPAIPIIVRARRTITVAFYSLLDLTSYFLTRRFILLLFSLTLSPSLLQYG